MKRPCFCGTCARCQPSAEQLAFLSSVATAVASERNVVFEPLKHSGKTFLGFHTRDKSLESSVVINEVVLQMDRTGLKSMLFGATRVPEKR